MLLKHVMTLLAGIKNVIITIMAISVFIITPILSHASISKAKTQYNSETIKDSIVKIYTVANQFNYQKPWNSSTSQFSGSGSIINGNQILTNAHVVANNTFLEVKRYGQTKRYQAQIKYVSHDADLAILTVNDPSFFSGTTSLQLGDLPRTQKEVVVYGFPRGGDTLSVTKGVVSRIEHQHYAHSSEYMLSIQIDAAINPGNSGGPVLADGKIAGIVMQGLSGSDNIGYMVPTTVVQHFLTDMKDGQYNGFPDLGIIVQDLENPSARKKHKLSEKQTGVLVNKVLFNSPAKDLIKAGDILTAIDSHNIANDGTVEFRPKEYTSFSYYIDKHQVNDTMSLSLIRHSKPMTVNLTLSKTSKDFWLVQREQYDQSPRYFIYGGFVFTPLSKGYLSANYSSFYGSTSELSKLLYAWPEEGKKEIVIISQVLAASFNKGYHHINDWAVSKIDGKSYKDFDEFYNIISNSKQPFVKLENDQGYEIIIDRKIALSQRKSLLKRYHIASSESSDLETIQAKAPLTRQIKPSNALISFSQPNNNSVPLMHQ